MTRMWPVSRRRPPTARPAPCRTAEAQADAALPEKAPQSTATRATARGSAASTANPGLRRTSPTAAMDALAVAEVAARVAARGVRSPGLRRMSSARPAVDALAVAGRVRVQGGTVAAGGCFGLLRVGPVGRTAPCRTAGGALLEKAVRSTATRATACGATGSTANPGLRRTSSAPRQEGAVDALAVAERVRGQGGTVAAGGCFGLLYAGHVGRVVSADVR